MSTFDEGVCEDCYTFAVVTGFCYVCTLKEVLVSERAAHKKEKANPIVWLRSLREQHQPGELADAIEKEWPTGPFRSQSRLCSDTVIGQRRFTDEELADSGAAHHAAAREQNGTP